MPLIQKYEVPQPPFWCATVVHPYEGRRGGAIDIDWIDLRATVSGRGPFKATIDAVALIAAEERRSRLGTPILIEASGASEMPLRCGESLAQYFMDSSLPAQVVISTEGDIPAVKGSHVVIGLWPVDVDAVTRLAEGAREAGCQWGLAIPIVHPVTTDLPLLEQLADTAAAEGASFLVGLVLFPEPTARRVLADSSANDVDARETYEDLFHRDHDPLMLATERHVSALAFERGLEDWIQPAGWGASTNWNAGVVLSRCASRMVAMDYEVEKAWSLVRSANVVARLSKPISTIVEIASLAIVESLDTLSMAIVDQWLAVGRSSFVDEIDDRWRLRRDYTG